MGGEERKVYRLKSESESESLNSDYYTLIVPGATALATVTAVSLAVAVRLVRLVVDLVAVGNFS